MKTKLRTIILGVNPIEEGRPYIVSEDVDSLVFPEADGIVGDTVEQSKLYISKITKLHPMWLTTFLFETGLDNSPKLEEPILRATTVTMIPQDTQLEDTYAWIPADSLQQADPYYPIVYRAIAEAINRS